MRKSTLRNAFLAVGCLFVCMFARVINGDTLVRSPVLFLAALGRVGFSSAVPMPRKNALCLLPRFLPHVAFGVCRYDGISSLEFF